MIVENEPMLHIVRIDSKGVIYDIYEFPVSGLIRAQSDGFMGLSFADNGLTVHVREGLFPAYK